jgi:hypothetical protein
MLPQKPYRSTYKKFGLIPKSKDTKVDAVPVTIQTFTFFTLLAPLMKFNGALEIDLDEENQKVVKSQAK